MKNFNSAKRLWPFTLAATVVTAVALSGCGGQSGARSVMNRSIKALTDGSGDLMCSYALPDLRSLCETSVALGGYGATGSVRVGDVVQHGDEAIGSLVGHICLTIDGSTSCGSNSDRKAGLPHGSVTFAEAFEAANDSDDTGDSDSDLNQPGSWTISAIRQNGKWYLDPGD